MASAADNNSIFKSAFLNPTVPSIPPRPNVIADPGAVPASTDQFLSTVKNLEAANFDLQAKLEKTSEQVKSLQKEKIDLIDRLEKALLIAAKLKDAEKDNVQLREKYAASEKELRALYLQRNQLDRSNTEKSQLLTQVREKYFHERSKTNELVTEVERVKTVADLAKREVDNQLSKVSLREAQLSTMRSLASAGELGIGPSQNNTVDELDMAFPSSNFLRGGSRDVSVAPSGLAVTSWKDWQVTKQVQADDKRVTENLRRILISGKSDLTGTLFDDNCMRLTVAVRIEKNIASINFFATNISPTIIKSVRILNSTRANSNFDFVLSPGNEAFLKPGQTMSCQAELRMSHEFDTPPTICMSYTPSGDIPRNNYLTIPVAIAKFCVPVQLSSQALLDKWTCREFEESEESCKFAIQREELKSFSNIAVLAEFGGSLLSQRGVDPNPRGQIFACALEINNRVKEVIARVELSPADQRGPVQCRVTVRSVQAVLTKAIMSNLLDVLI